MQVDLPIAVPEATLPPAYKDLKKDEWEIPALDIVLGDEIGVGFFF